MVDRKRQSGFSLTEVLMAAGILAIGFMLIAMIFPVGIKLTATATERTIGALVAEEAKAKLKLYADYSNIVDFARFDPRPDYEVMLLEDVLDRTGSFFFTNSAHPNVKGGLFLKERFYEMLYPSLAYCDADDYNDPANNVLIYRTDVEEASYRWTALCIETDPSDPLSTDVEMLILVTHRLNKNAKFPIAEWNSVLDYGYENKEINLDLDVYPYPHPGDWPMPIRVYLEKVDDYNWIIDTSARPDDSKYINKGDIVIDVDGTTGFRQFRVMDKYGVAGGNIRIELDGDLRPGAAIDTSAAIWVVPPATGSSRSPLVGVYSGGLINFK